jgi:hypothetical protein
MKKRLILIAALLIAAMTMPAYAATTTDYIDAYDTYLTNYNMNNVNSYCCGPTAGSEILAYWDQSKGKDNVWQPDSAWSSGTNVIRHLIKDMGTTASVGTTPANFRSGIEKHVRGTCGNPTPRTSTPLPNYTGASAVLYQKTGGSSLADMWNVIKNEVGSDRPVAIYIGHYPDPYDSGILYEYFKYHWQVIYGYSEETDQDGNITNRTVYTRTGFGGVYGYMDLNAYWDYVNDDGEGIDNIAIVTLSSL